MNDINVVHTFIIANNVLLCTYVRTYIPTFFLAKEQPVVLKNSVTRIYHIYRILLLWYYIFTYTIYKIYSIYIFL